MGARALLNNECSSPQNNGCSCTLRIMGARPHFSREHFMNSFFYDSFLYSYVFIHLFSNWVFFEWWVPVPFWKMSARAPKIMGARALKNNGCAPSFFQESISWTFSSCSFLQLFTRSPFDCSLNDECSCPPGKWVLKPSKRGVLELSKIMGARPHFFKNFGECIYQGEFPEPWKWYPGGPGN